jgi:hypothetical protein
MEVNTMNRALLNTLKLMALYLVITALISLQMIGRWKFAFWLEPLQILFLLDLIPIDGFNRTDGLYKVSELRKNISVVVNITLIFSVFFLSFLPKRKWLRNSLVIISSIIFIAWYLFITIGLVLSSAG